MAGDHAGDGSDDVVVVRFSVTDPSYPFVGASELGRVHLERMFPRESGRYAEFFSVDGVEPARVAELASADEGIEARIVERYADGGLLEFSVTGGCPARDLAELGAIPQAAGGADGEGWVEAEIPRTEDASTVVSRFLDRHPSIDLTSKRTQSALTPLFSPAELQRAVDRRLTDRQHAVLCTAYEAGFYEAPRAATAEAIADELDISGATFSQHRRAAERKLVSLVTEGRPSSGAG